MFSVRVNFLLFHIGQYCDQNFTKLGWVQHISTFLNTFLKKKVCQLIHFWNDSLLKYGRSSFSYLDLVLHDNEFEKISLTSSISHFYPFSFLATRGWTTRGCFASFCKQTGSAQCYECEWIDGKIGLAIAEKSKGMCLLVTHHLYILV